MNPSDPEVSVGASDSLIIAISITGFALLATTFYFVLVRPTNAANANDEKDPTGAPSYADLKRAKVTDLNRAQRRARARTIAKEETKSLGSKEERQRKQRDIELRERRAEQDEIDRLQKQQLQQAAKEKAVRNAEKEKKRTAKNLAELEQWETFIERGDWKMSVVELSRMLKENRMLNLARFSQEHNVSMNKLSGRLSELVRDGRIAGVFSNDSTRFIYFSDEELSSLADDLKEQQKMSFSELAAVCQQHILG